MPRGIEYKAMRSPLDQIDMIDCLAGIKGRAVSHEAGKVAFKKQLHTYASEIEHMGDVEALFKTMIHFM